MIQTFNILLNTSPEAFRYWHNQLVETRNAYNDCSEYMFNNNTPLALKTVHDNVYDWLRKTHPSLPAQAVIKVYKDVLSAFRSIKGNRHRIKHAPQKRHLAMRLDKRLYTRMQQDGIVMCAGTEGKRELIPFVLYDKATEMLLNYPTHDPLIYERDGRLFLSVPFEVQEKPVLSDDCIGVDLGLRRLFVTTDGVAFRDEKYLDSRRKLRHNKKGLQSCGTKSARHKLRKLKNREHNLSNDLCHRAANALLSSTTASVIVLEDLEGIKRKTSKTKNGFKRKTHNRRMGQAPIRGFRDILTHKAQRVGKRVETVSPTYTSQTDCRTGKRDGERKRCRYVCSDGVVLDADWNASCNIAHRSGHPVSNCLPVDGGLRFLTGRALSTARKCSKSPQSTD